jgi:hypothetical protein
MGKPKGATAEAQPAQTDQPSFEQVPFARLRPWLLNPNEGDVEGIMASLRTYGWGRPILANRYPKLEGEIIIGHHTLMAAQRLEAGGEVIRNGIPGHAPTVWTSLPAKKAHGLSLADNQRAKAGNVTDDKLGLVVGLDELDPEEWLAAGFAEKQIKGLMFGGDWPKPASTGRNARGKTLKYSVIIDCDDETQQTELLERFEAEGIRCKPWVG